MRFSLFSPRFVFALAAGVPLVYVAALLATTSRTAAQNAPPAPVVGSASVGSVNVSRTSWIGNTLSGKNGAYMVNFCDAIYAAPDGTVYTNTFFEEGGHEISAYKWDAAQSAWRFLGAGGRAHGEGGRAITGNGTHLFAGQMLTDQRTGAVRFGVARRDLRYAEMPPLAWKTGGTDANAVGWAPSIPAFLALSQPIVPVQGKPGRDLIGLWRQRSVRGIAATKTRLFVSVPGEAESTDTVRVFDLSRPDVVAPLSSWRVPNAGALAYDPVRGDVWVVQNTRPESGDGSQGRYVIRCFDEKGTARAARNIALPPGAFPQVLAWDAKNRRLLVPDAAAAQQVLAFSSPATGAAAPAAVAPIGLNGGIYSGSTAQGRFPVLGDKSVRLFGPRGVSSDALGNVYVMGAGANGMVRLDVLNDRGTLLQPSLVAAEAVSIADADPAEGTSVYSDSKHYRINYNAVPGKEAQLVGLTANPVTFPQDPRLAIPFGTSGVRAYRIQNRLFLYIKFARGVGIFRFDPARYGETAIPCGFITEENVTNHNWPFWTPDLHQWIWRDLNGDGRWDKNEFALPPQPDPRFIGNLSPVHNWIVDKNGTLTTVKVLSYGLVSHTMRGLDKWGSPIYDANGTSDKIGTVSPQTESALPAPFESDRNQFENLAHLGVSGAEVSRLSYDAASDTMFLSGFSTTYPDTFAASVKVGRIDYSNPPLSGAPGTEKNWKKQNEDADGNAAGRLLAAYPRWSQGNRTPSWVRPLPFRSLANDYFRSDIPNGIAVAGKYVFVGYRYSQRIVMYDAKTGTPQPEYFLPDEKIVGDNHGALDIDQPISALFLSPDAAQNRPNGEYVVWAESNTRARILMHRWKPKTP